MPPQDPVPQPKPLRPIPWWIAICGLVAIGMSIWGVYLWLSSAASGADTAKDAQVQVDIIRNALTVGAGLGGVAALLLAFRRQHFVERQHEFYERQQRHHELTARRDYEQRERTAEHVEADATHRRITEMRIQAVEQLGSDKAPVRIGGLHNLERLGEDHPELRPLVLSEICAYLRMPFRVPAAALRLAEPDSESGGLEEHNVRQTAQRVLKRHLSGGASDPHFWEHEALDLSDATLHSLDLRSCHLYNVNFYYARFHGTTRLEGAQFFGSTNFSSATAHGAAGFRGAAFHGRCGFMSVKFHNTVDFEAVEFEADPDVSGSSAPLDHEHFWPPGWSLVPDPRQVGMGFLKLEQQLPDRLQ